MIVVTGAAGFIGSCLVEKLSHQYHEKLVIVDDFSREDKRRNFIHKQYKEQVDRVAFMPWLKAHASEVEAVFHLGARTNTAEFDWMVLEGLNLAYSQSIWRLCTTYKIPLIYASSAATYGAGELGYEDNHDIIPQLEPLNPYGKSKNDFDKWVLTQTETPPFWAGFKFFNVFGPNEYHKGRMASVILHAFKQINETGGMKIFKSHRPDFEDGMQLRDFVYVKDIVNVLTWSMDNKIPSAIYNLGSGEARSFLDLTKATFAAMGKRENIGFIPIPEDIRDKYQYYTKAAMHKLKEAGYPFPFTTLEDGVKEYVQEYLIPNKIY